ncbi:twin-arginine translocase subunit TatB [Aliihoeflea aestuarii]|jgi:sec-independent protein translocase protein TatB|uniref:Sec-independent protein translocase protein TatB n=1 Tax=Aliihoeflea aestuarii TaxID=453840 RepID=UPI0020927A6B|nr:Sec-independent protein translocase protein TatB [Aliihoeflea aestuarii]MCO6390714.1 twin-arginine translocase subunit TatB [Aliihoeflea aestuarii]
MFDLSWSEILIIAIVLIVVVGPKDLPRVLRSFGKTMSKVRSMAGDFRKQFDEALKEAELDDLKSLADDARKLNPASEIRKALNPMEQAAKDVRAGVDKAMKPATPISAEKPASTPQPAEPQKAGAAALPEGLASKPDIPAKATGEPVKAAKPPRKAPAKANGVAAKHAASAKPKAAPAAKKTTTVKATATKSAAAKAKADK